MRKVFPDHWSFMIGEVCLYSFIILVITGVYLTFFFHPSLNEVAYHGPYIPLQGVRTSEAYSSTTDISFDVRGGLLIRQIHHWSSHIFIAGLLVHMLRHFFGGSFRKPREMTWLLGFSLLILALFESYLGNMLPDDLLSGTGLRVMEGLILSVPIVGSYLVTFVFGGEFPGSDYVARFYSIHVLLFPGIMAGLVVAHLLLVFHHKHTQYPGPGRTNTNVVGMPFLPVYLAKTGGFFFLVAGFTTLVGGLAQINPIWTYGPYIPDQVSSGSQPDWYMGIAEGAVRLMPGWEINLWGHTLVLGVAIPLLVFVTLLASIGAYPFIESWITGDTREHHLLDRPRDQPVRTAIGAAWISLYLVLLAGGGNDLIATHFHLSVNVITWCFRFDFVVVPVLVFVLTKRWCLGLQRRDRDKVLHGRESGTIERLPYGEYHEVHLPLSQAELHTLTTHEQPHPQPSSPGEAGRRPSRSRMTRLRLRLFQAYYGEGTYIPKPTAEEFRDHQQVRPEDS